MEAAANTVRRLSSASAGDSTKPHNTAKAAKSPAIRYMVALHACSASVLRAQFGRWLCWDRNRRKRRSVDPKDLRSVRRSHRQAYSIVGPAQTFRAIGYSSAIAIAWRRARSTRAGTPPAIAPVSLAVSASAAVSEGWGGVRDALTRERGL